MNEEKLREKYLELQTASEQVKQMQAHLQGVEAKRRELESNADSLESISKHGASEMLVPVVDGIFMKAKSASADEVIVNVGAGVCVKKSMAEAKELLNEKLQEIRQFEREMLQEIEKGANAAKKLEEELSQLIESKEKNV